MNKTMNLGSDPVGKLLASYSVPAVIAMLVNAIYNVVDRIFIGKFAGEAALAGLTIVFPAMMLIFAFAGLIGIGGASLVSIRLGENDQKGASKVFGNMLIASTLTSLAISILMYVNLESVLTFFGADAVTMPHANAYMSIILIGIVFQLTSFSLSGIVRSEGQPLLSMVSMLASALTNILLDYIFIVEFGWGANGAALATIIGQFSGLAILAQYFLRGRSNMDLSKESLTVDLKLLGQILSIGATTFLSTVGTSAAMMVLNRSLISYGDMAAITSMGAINSMFTMFIMPIMGIQQGMQPIIGFNHGAEKHGRVRQALIIGMGISVGFSLMVFIALQWMPETLMSMFLDPNSNTMNIAVNGLRIFILALPVLPINMLGTAYFQSIASSKKALFLGASRQFLFLIPLTLVLPTVYGLNGVWFATPIADSLAVISTLILLLPALKKSVNNFNSVSVDRAPQVV